MDTDTKQLLQLSGTDILTLIIFKFDWFSEHDQHEVAKLLTNIGKSKEEQRDIYKYWSLSVNQKYDFKKFEPKTNQETYTDMLNQTYQVKYQLYTASEKGIEPIIDKDKLVEQVWICKKYGIQYMLDTYMNYNHVITDGFFWRQMYHNKESYPAIVVELYDTQSYIFKYYRIDNTNDYYIIDYKNLISEHISVQNWKITRIFTYKNFPNSSQKLIKKEFFDEHDKYHNEEGPALIRYFDNGKPELVEYYKHGELYREHGPALTEYYENGQMRRKEWVIGLFRTEETNYQQKKYHNIFGPAIEIYFNNGKVDQEYWYRNGKLYREDGPSVIKYFPDGKLRYRSWNSCNSNNCNVYEHYSINGNLIEKQYKKDGVLVNEKKL